jgi:hypothetical protein
MGPEHDVEAYDAELRRRREEFARRGHDLESMDGVRMLLQHLVDLDQFMRTYSQTPWERGYGGTELHDAFRKLFMPRWHALDEECAATLRSLLARWGWFRRGTWGELADANAWLLAQHADHDVAFQKDVLGMMAPLVESGETRPAHYAYLFDRVAVNEGRPQRFGTQGCCTGSGTWAPRTVEEPEGVDERRRAMGMEPLADYVKRASGTCREDER